MNESFEQLVGQVTAGLKKDGELYLDVKQRVRRQLEEKARHFAAEGYGEEESVELAKKSFGSPTDLAAEIVAANRRRMKLRTLVRAGFYTLIVPFLIVLVLCSGYGRYAQISYLLAGTKLPLVGLFANSVSENSALSDLSSEHPDKIYAYWKAHKNDPESCAYYAYYCIYLRPKDESSYVAAMRFGERLEPQNALYNLLLAEYYLGQGMHYKGKEFDRDEVLDRGKFELGVAEFERAYRKPYLHSYHGRVLAVKLASLKVPFLTEDYLYRIAISASETFPDLASHRRLARSVPGCARLLIGDGHRDEALAVMDGWRPFTNLLIGDSYGSMISRLVACASGVVMAKEATSVYEALGQDAKSWDAKAVYRKLKAVNLEWKGRTNARYETVLKRKGGTFAACLSPVYGAEKFSGKDLKPGRMLEYVLCEETAIQSLATFFSLFLLGALLHGSVWLIRLRGAAMRPILLMPPWKEALRIFFLGMLIPMGIYIIYSSFPDICGRDISLRGGMMERFIGEMRILVSGMFLVPVFVIHRYIRRRCVELGIDTPSAGSEFAAGVKALAVVFISLALVVLSLALSEISAYASVIAVVVSLLSVGYVIFRVWNRRGRYDLYFGTLARSMAPMYAVVIILLSFTVQPYLMCNEASLLARDTLMFGGFRHPGSETAGFSGLEQRAARTYTHLLNEAINIKE